MSQPTTGDACDAIANNESLKPSWQRHPLFSQIFETCNRPKEFMGMKPIPELWDISKGCILWLPPKVEIRDKIPSPRPDVDVEECELWYKGEAYFDTPVLVLEVHMSNPSAAKVTCARMRSLGERTLEETFPDLDKQERKLYLPIAPSLHPDHKVQLRLEEGDTANYGMMGNSYIKLTETFKIDFMALRCYAEGQRPDGFRYRLHERSFRRILLARESLHMPDVGRGPWIKTNALWENFATQSGLLTDMKAQINNALDSKGASYVWPCWKFLEQKELQEQAQELLEQAEGMQE